MCGITGIIDPSGNRIEPRALVDMNTAIRHRGPDDEGYVFIEQRTGQYAAACGEDSPPIVKKILPKPKEIELSILPNIGLGQRRFSIIDLTSDGHQPFFSFDRSCCVVFNGEIYNYIELREELIGMGGIFHTASDTEVLVEAYRLLGTDCFSRLNGFWAASIYDFKRRQLVLSRDRLGKKPLYWTKQGARVYFASEIKALFQVEEIARSKHVNQTSTYLWLRYGLRDIQENTFFDGIYSFPAASWAIVDKDFPNAINRFWQLPNKRVSEKEISPADASRSVRYLLSDAISIRLRADVPLAIELSGGMDSSTLVALASELSPRQISAYTVRFPEDKWNEERFARSVAQHYHVDYRVLESPIENFWAQILPCTHLQEEPYHAPNLQTNQVIWTLMRAAGTKVSLNGAAGDELFSGYRPYFINAQLENWQERRVKCFLQNAVQWSEQSTNGEGIVKSLIALASGSMALRSLYGMVKRRKTSGFINTDPVSHPLLERTLSQVLHSDMTNTMVPYWMRSGDKTFMGVPLEVRTPFLDYRLVEYVFQIPTSYLIRDGWHKWILRKAMDKILPRDVLWRKKKLGFPFPYERFFKDSKTILKLVFTRSQNPYIDFRQADNFKYDWRVISFLLWYELFFNENIPLFQAIADIARQRGRLVNYGFLPEFLHH